MSIDVKKEARDYFGREAFQSLFTLFKKKIESLGSVSGTVKLFPNEEEKQAIELWMGTKIKTVPVSISLVKFEKRLIGSKFEPLSLFELVELITNEPILFNKDREQQAEEEKSRYFKRLFEDFPHRNAQLIIGKIINKDKGSTSFIKSYNEKNYDDIEIILKAVSVLPEQDEFERLPVFAERITGNPHYFDKNKKLLQAIEIIMSENENRPYRSQLNAEDESELLSKVNLAKDDLHSFVTCYGLEAYRSGKRLEQWHAANVDNSVQNIPLRSLNNIDIVKPTKGNKVFVLENSGVYSSILDKLTNIAPVVCTHGNFKLSGLILIDKLVKGDTQIFYSGDMDVRGVALASYLKQKYPNNVHIWRMSVEEYKHCISNVPIMNIDKVTAIDDFKELIKEMNVIQKAGYQEPLLNLYIRDIEFFVKSN